MISTLGVLLLAVIGDYGDAFEGISGGNELLKKAIGATIWKTGYQIISIFIAYKAQGNQHEIRIAFFERDYFVNN